MKTFMNSFGSFGIIVIAIICFGWFCYKAYNISTPEAQDFLANFSEEHHQIIAAVDRFARHDKLIVRFKTDNLKADLEQLREKNILDNKVLQILYRSYTECNEYLGMLDIDTNREIWNEFHNYVVQPLRRYYYLYKVNKELREIAISNDCADAETRELLYTLSPGLQRISKLIEVFEKNYRGYFDKEAFNRAIDGIRKSQSLNDAKAVVKRLSDASRWCSLAYYHDGGTEWVVIDSEVQKLASLIDDFERVQ